MDQNKLVGGLEDFLNQSQLMKDDPELPPIVIALYSIRPSDR